MADWAVTKEHWNNPRSTRLDVALDFLLSLIPSGDVLFAAILLVVPVSLIGLIVLLFALSSH